MNCGKLIVGGRLWLLVWSLGAAVQAAVAQEKIVLHASRLIDGTGSSAVNPVVTVEGGIIRTVETGGKVPNGVKVVELGELTLLPGLIDTHVHITSHFEADGSVHLWNLKETADVNALFAAENAYRMLMAGFTTIQTLGLFERPTIETSLRDAINRGVLPGPRILASLAGVDEKTGDPEAIRAFVRARKAEGADVIKIFASLSIKEQGRPTLSQDQLDAACGEAKALSMRAVVHTHGPVSTRMAVLAGCSSIEHGALLDADVLKLMAERGVYFDPNIYLLYENYLALKDKLMVPGGMKEDDFAEYQKAIPLALRTFRLALTIPNLKIVFGTDAVAGALGRNVEELIYQVEVGGQSTTSAIRSITSLAAESLGLGSTTGTIRPGLAADIIAVEGNPVDDIKALRRIRFVMKSGRIVYIAPDLVSHSQEAHTQ
jgi:imidazolonepropionase-like amidohydrolase